MSRALQSKRPCCAAYGMHLEPSVCGDTLPGSLRPGTASRELQLPGLLFATPRLTVGVITGLCSRTGPGDPSADTTSHLGTAVSRLLGSHLRLATAELVSHRHCHRFPAVPAGVGAWTRRVQLPIRLRLWTPPHKQFSRARSGSRVTRRHTLSSLSA